VGEDG
jgi:hypothetical protein